MKFEFLELHAENFVLYEKLDIDFRSLENNLIFIEGENNDVSGLDSNGAGKTLIGDLIADLLFDKTIRRHPVKSLIGKFKKYSYAFLAIKNSLSEEEYVIKKYRSHPDLGDSLSFLKLNSSDGTYVSLGKKLKADTYKEIWKTFGVNWRSFKNRNYFGQDDPERFLRVTNSAKAKIMVDMQGLHDLQKAKEISGERKRNFSKEEESVLQEIKGYTLSHKSLEEALENAKNERKKKAIERAKKLRGIDQEIKEISLSLFPLGVEDLKKKINEVRNRVRKGKKIKKFYFEFLEELSSLRRDHESLVNLIADETENIRRLMRKILQEKKKISDLKKCLITVCDKCGAKLTEEGTKASIVSVKKDCQKNIKKLKSVKASLENHEKVSASLKKQILEFDEKKVFLSAKVNKYDELFDVFEELKAQELEELRKNSKIEALIKSKENIGKPSKKSSSAEVSLGKSLEISKKKLLELKKALNDIRMEMSKNEFSEKAFERSMRIMFDSFLDGLNHHANMFLDILCDNDIDVSFQPKTKKGSKKLVDEVQVLVSVDGAAPRDFRTYSGGEKARVDLAVQLTLFSSSASPFPFLFLDEPFTGIDLDGRGRILSLLQEISEKGNIVFVVSNKNVPIGYGTALKVIREGRKSRIEAYV